MERTAILLALLVGLSATAVSVPVAAGDAAAGQVDGCEYPFEATDATNTEVTVSSDPQRVVTMAPSAAQTVWEIGGRDEVVGVSQYATYLDGAAELANVSAPGFGSYNVERIVELEPDVVLAPNVIPTASVERIRSAGVTVFKMAPATSIADVREKTALIGRLTGNCEGAADANAWMDANLQAVSEAVGDRSAPRALNMLSGGFTTGSGTFIHDMITSAGAENVAAEAGIAGYREISQEVVVERDPQYLLVGSSGSPYPDQEPYASTTAVREGNVVSLAGLRTGQPAPRTVVYAVRNLTESFHGEAYGPSQYVSREAATTTPTPTVTATPTETVTPTEAATPTETTAVDADPTGETVTATMQATGPDGTTTDSGGQGMPGFGPLLALVALAAGILVLSRRRA
jgi:iron complex transport system substrate-binding protein